MWDKPIDCDSFEEKSTMSNAQVSASRVGERFVEYYESLGYKAIPGSSLLDPSVPMTFVMSAGLVQVEKVNGKTGTTQGKI